MSSLLCINKLMKVKYFGYPLYSSFESTRLSIPASPQAFFWVFKPINLSDFRNNRCDFSRDTRDRLDNFIFINFFSQSIYLVF